MKPPDPQKGLYIFASGKKGSGKSYICRAWFDQYPFDRIVIDPTHDVRADLRRDGVEFESLEGEALPARLPAHNPEHRKTWVFAPDMGSPTVDDDMDRVTGLAIDRGPTLIWFDEYGVQTSANKVAPNMRRVLHHGRHSHLTALFACPRPKDIGGLAINQSDLVYTFRTPNPDDRLRIAQNIGFDPKEFDQVNASLATRGDHWHSLYDARSDELWVMPPLPRRKTTGYPIPESGDVPP